MLLVDEHLVCTCHKCRAEFVVKTKPAIQKQNMRCACGCELKKVYRSPVLTVFGTASEIGRLNLHLDAILARLENLKRLRHSSGQ
jgi:hypothetical protein